MTAPKYAKLENERRFLVKVPPTLPDVFRRIEDRYLIGTRLRLRDMIDSATGSRDLKFCKKYEGDDPVSGPVTNLYLNAAEHAALAALPARTILKRRYRLDHDGRAFSVDVFEGELLGLVLCEAEADSREVVMALAFPPWAGPEVTWDPAFTGGRLSSTTAAELRALLDHP